MPVLERRRSALACWGLLAAVQFGYAAVQLGPAAVADPEEPAWSWPIDRPELLRGFTRPEQDWSGGHRGIDLAAAPGDQVTAIGPGMVAYVGVIDGKPFVSIDHPGTGLRSTYEPVLATVKPGERVTARTIIGKVAVEGGHCARRCLHLGVKRVEGLSRGSSAAYLDPMSLLRRWAILKPVPRRRPSDAPG